MVNATTARETAQQHKADLLRSLRLCTAEGIVAMPIVTMSLPVNVFMTALVAKSLLLPKTTTHPLQGTIVSEAAAIGETDPVFGQALRLRPERP